MKKIALAILMTISTPALSELWYVSPGGKSSNVSSGEIQARSTDDAAAYVVRCSNPKSDAVTISDALIIFDRQITNNTVDVRAGKAYDKEPFLFSSEWKVMREKHSATLSPPRGIHLRDFMLDGGSLEVRFITDHGPDIVKFSLEGFASAYRKLIHSCK
ncbi:hypothetical protein V5081_00200 [Enterobacter cancerogenus]|uniref:hypothetical protein n=1 Tax=Enterobacter cancerogenus TaxID=69218 RepID=UPI003076446A